MGHFDYSREPKSDIVFVEDGAETGGVSAYLSGLLKHKNTEILAFSDMFFPQGSRQEIFEAAGMSPEHIAQSAKTLLSGVNTAQNERRSSSGGFEA